MPAVQGAAIRERFPPANDQDRAAVLRYVSQAPLRYGEWKHLKALYKQAENAEESEILGTLIGRLDAEPLSPPGPSLPFHLDRRYPGETLAVAASGDVLFVVGATGRAGGDLQVFDLADPVQPRRVGSLSLREMRALAVQGELLYGAGQGLQVVDVSNQRRPRLIGSLDAGNLVRIVAAGRYLYCLAEGTPAGDGLLVIDVSDPTRPSRAAFLELKGARDLTLAGRHLYVVGESSRSGWFGLRPSGGLTVIDVSRPLRPRKVGEATVPGGQAIAVSGSYAYVCAWEGRRRTNTLHVFHLFTPTTPRLAGSVGLRQPPPVPGRRWSVVVRGQEVYIVTSNAGVRVVNAANPARPVAAAVYSSYGAAGLALFESIVCIAGAFGDLSLFDITEPARPVLLGTRPSRDTFGYMKRRARRLLRALARQDPDRFARVAFHALMVSGQARPELEPADQWVSVELLYGGSGRYAQASHGEGRCYPRWQRRFRRRREERAPEAWDRRPELPGRLVTAASLPWQTREAAVKMLRDRGQPLPPLSADALAPMLQSPSPLLVVVAAREAVRQVTEGATLAPEAAAAAFFAANSRGRRQLAGRWFERRETQEWEERFAAALCRFVGERSSQGLPGRRVIAAAALLAERFASTLTGEALIPTAIALLASERAELPSLAASLLATASPTAAPEWLAALARLPEDRRDRALETFIGALRGREIDRAAARRLAFAETAWEREAGWRLLAGLPAPPAVLAPLWTEILAAEGLPPALRTALHSAAALGTLRAARLLDADLDARLSERALRAELMTPELLADVAQIAPPGILVRMVAEASAADWARLRDPLLHALEESGRLTPFWQSAWPALEEDRTGQLRRRLLEDRQVADSFLEVEGTEFLESRYPAVAGLLLRWIEWRQAQFARDSAELLAAATAPLPEVREWGLRRAAALGMEMPFALRLLESGLPEPAEAGRAFFDALPSGSEEALDYALALCDSPEASVRAYGREYVRQRRATLPLADLVRPLSEHADPLMQEFVAGLLLEEPKLAPEVGEFDRTALRAPDRARRARELVKRRLERVPPEEIPLLLEIARSGLDAGRGRDAEWAWAQLARLALEGHVIEGFTVDGTAGV